MPVFPCPECKGLGIKFLFTSEYLCEKCNGFKTIYIDVANYVIFDNFYNCYESVGFQYIRKIDSVDEDGREIIVPPFECEIESFFDADQIKTLNIYCIRKIANSCNIGNTEEILIRKTYYNSYLRQGFLDPLHQKIHVMIPNIEFDKITSFAEKIRKFFGDFKLQLV